MGNVFVYTTGSRRGPGLVIAYRAVVLWVVYGLSVLKHGEYIHHPHRNTPHGHRGRSGPLKFLRAGW
eukprot:3948881-Heterocapsa_arctica.AAC.1